MNIYFAGSISGGRKDVNIYAELINYLDKYGTVLTEHIGDKNIDHLGEHKQNSKFIHDRDLKWVLKSEVIIAEVTTPSLGVGYEIGRGVENNKKILCLYRPKKNKSLSKMISGNKDVNVSEYQTIEEAKKQIDKFFKKINI